MSFESGRILALGLELSLQFLNEKFEPQDFVSQLLDFRTGAGRRGRTRHRDGSGLAAARGGW